MRRVDPAEVERIDGLLARLPVPASLSPAQVARIRGRITDRPARRPVRRVAIALAVTFVVATTAVAMYRLRPIVPRLIPAPVLVPDVEVRQLVPTRITVHEVAPVAAPPPGVAAPLRPRPRARLAVAPDPAAVQAAEGPLGIESRLIATALRQLRGQRDPRAALATLDQYAARFPRGVLAGEARAARIEGVLALGDHRTALALLDTGPVKGELAVARGELRLAAGRVEEAARDFNAALIGADDGTEQRALYGRAACRIRLGDEVGARRDLEEYLRRFPRGRSAAAARQVIERLSVKGPLRGRP